MFFFTEFIILSKLNWPEFWERGLFCSKRLLTRHHHHFERGSLSICGEHLENLQGGERAAQEKQLSSEVEGYGFQTHLLTQLFRGQHNQGSDFTHHPLAQHLKAKKTTKKQTCVSNWQVSPSHIFHHRVQILFNASLNLNRMSAAHLYNRYDKCQCLATACWRRHTDISGLVATSSNQQALLCTFQDGRDHLLLYCWKDKAVLNKESIFIYSCQSFKISTMMRKRTLPGKRCWIPLLWSFLTSLAEISETSARGTRLLLMSLWIMSGWASHWGRTLWTCQHTNRRLLQPVKIAVVLLSINNKCIKNNKVPSVLACSQILPELWIPLEPTSLQCLRLLHLLQPLLPFVLCPRVLLLCSRQHLQDWQLNSP